MHRRGLLSALAVAFAAFALYRSALLPDFDLGDTGSLQTTVSSPYITPREAYPLYFALAKAFVRLTRKEPAAALNLASAVEAAVACGLMVLAGAELSGSIAAASAAALLFAVSYTFWSQAVIAEVYALHTVFITLTLLLALQWARRPTDGRLLLFFAVYALGFGNHLSMILLAPGFTIFLLISGPRGWRSVLRPRVVAMALACAMLGALQYTWNLHTLWLLPDPPHGIVDALQRFWFDVTKSDWRDTMVMHVPQSLLTDHLAMYWFDLRQQFGIAGAVLGAAGLGHLAVADWRRAVLMAALYAANVIFAYSYNVGDAHVFYLPSHLVVAMLAAPAVMMAERIVRRAAPVAAACLALYAGARAYRDYPALDRSHDDRPTAVLSALTAGVDDRHAILLTDLNWQVQNGLSYYASVKRPEVAWWRMPDVLLYAPALVADNRAIGREVLLTERARASAVAAYGPLMSIAVDPRVAAPRLPDAAAGLPPGTRYVLCVLRPSRDLTIDKAQLGELLRSLAARRVSLPEGDYAAAAGIVGRPPERVTGAMRPFHQHVELDGVSVDIRMESWLASDTIRRMGFGHVVAARQHTLIVERGVSFAAFDESGRPIRTAYASNIFAPQPRYAVRLTPDTTYAAAKP